ncbi:ATPase AAA [Arthrobacter crystallopoietes BAB-32]|uniref:ATPase AAA n=1 Tax=Arthrobacter crystallopoietes BAB-32 TaxID=1246476 RepID=N1V0J4_9MICC|nr:Clp protease N-terminal domain-containing protein [Arthrobacter crystallopoietes]EMY33564.1 ATPase AAA [Arthrobacter crystallopoietes BAB-32]
MFERFTDRARRIVVLAQEEARMLLHKEIDTEHLLLALIHQDGPAARSLASLGAPVDAIRQETLELIGTGAIAPAGHMPFTMACRKILELALREAMIHGGEKVDDLHILLAIIRHGEGIAADQLAKHGVQASALRAAAESASEPGIQRTFAGYVAVYFEDLPAVERDASPILADTSFVYANKATAEDQASRWHEVRKVVFALKAGEFFAVTAGGTRMPQFGNFLDYTAAVEAAKTAGLSEPGVAIMSPEVRDVTARAADGSLVVIGQSTEWVRRTIEPLLVETV